MTHKRNTTGLASAAKERREETIKRVDTAIKQLVKEKKPINFNSISKTANVGKPWLYQESSVRQQIENLRQKTRLSAGHNRRDKIQMDNASNKSKDNLIHMLKERINKLEIENKKLHEQVEVLYGEIYLKNK